MKIYEIASKATGIEIEMYGKTIRLNRIGYDKSKELIDKGLIGNASESTTQNIDNCIAIAFDIMDDDSRAEFNNDLKVFKDCLTIKELNAVCIAIQEAVTNANPIKPPKKKQS